MHSQQISLFSKSYFNNAMMLFVVSLHWSALQESSMTVYKSSCESEWRKDAEKPSMWLAWGQVRLFFPKCKWPI